MDRRRFLTAAGSLAILAPSIARAAPGTPDDLVILRRALALHPGLYRYATPAEVEARLDRLAIDWRATDTLEGRYLALSRFLATIRCGHSYANFFNQKRAVAEQLFDRPTRLPFHFRWIGGAMVVIADHSGQGLAPGTQVLRIDGRTPAQMLAQLMPYARADGGNDAKRVSLLEVRGDDRIEYFDVFQGLLMPPPGGVHRVTVRDPGGRIRTVALPPHTLAQRRAAMAPAREVAWDWEMRADGVAVLTMPGWALYDSKWDWRGWLDERLASLKGAKGLVVDLRDNEGGIDAGDAILARLIDRPLASPGMEQRIRFRRTPTDLDRYLDTWDDSFRTLGVGADDLGGGWLQRPGPAGDDTIAPAGPRLTVPVAALVGPVNSSATHQFALRAKDSGLIRLFGRTTGGNRRGINGGCFFFLRLPDSGIECDVPLVGTFPVVPQPDAGVLPDVAVTDTAADIAAGRDPTLEAAASWCRRG